MDAALNVACAGGEPLALTDCLNFGNPEKPEIGWELAQAIDGIAQAANELGIPVVSGNVSLYNETGGRADPADAGRRLRRPRARRDARSRRAGGAATASFLLRGEGAGLVRFVWQNAHRFTLAHDVSDGGARARAARGGGLVGARRADARTSSTAQGVIVAVAPRRGADWDDVVELGRSR